MAKYPSISVAAWAYLAGMLVQSDFLLPPLALRGLPGCPAFIASSRPASSHPAAAAGLMGVTAALFTDAADWHFPHAMMGPMLYWILVCSVFGYLTIAWAMKFLPASQVQMQLPSGLASLVL